VHPAGPVLPESFRRPYRRPTLKVYGDLRDVTLTSLSDNMNDPGNNSRTMT
jgi:hypothetical protein